jgi:hypothetical protein
MATFMPFVYQPERGPFMDKRMLLNRALHLMVQQFLPVALGWIPAKSMRE